jgi:4-amino-4-deoxy-L-arabinose transferase-like glycosyltransferase
MLGSCVEYIVLSRACVTDMVLATFMLYGVLFFFYGYLKSRRYFYILSSIAFALATLTKGPIAIILSGASILIFLILAKDLKGLKKMPIFWMVVVFIAVAAPWYLLEYKLHGKAFIDVFFGFHNVTRFFESEHKVGSQFYYNIPIVFGGFFPWSVFLPFGLWHMFKKAQSEKNGPIFILVWFLAIFVFFSISSTKLPTYIFPSFISLALIVAVLWDDFLQRRVSQAVIRGTRFSYYLLVIAMVLGPIGIMAYLKYDYPVILRSAAASAPVLVLGAILSFLFFLKKRIAVAFFLIFGAIAVFILPVTLLVLPKIDHYESSKEIVKKLVPLMKETERLGAESNYVAGLAFYTGKVPADLDKHHAMVQFLSSPDRVWAVMKEKNHIQLYTLDSPPFLMKPTYMVYNIGKRAIVTNRIPDDGKYIIKRERVK